MDTLKKKTIIIKLKNKTNLKKAKYMDVEETDFVDMQIIEAF